MATALLKLTDVQLGTSVTATNNFTFYQPSTPDGTVRIGNGNSGSATDIMTLNSSGNVGIGTSSPAVKFHVASSSSATYERIDSSAYRIYVGAENDGNGIYSQTIGGTDALLRFYTGSTERMRLDSSGNLGLGVTPSAWRTSYGQKSFQFGPVGFVYSLSASSTNNQTTLGSNYYLDSVGSPKYINADYATSYTQSFGQHVWQLSTGTPSAGGTVTFTQAMTLDASGNLGVGTSSPSVRLHAKTGNSGTVSDSRYIVTAEGGSEAYLCAAASDYAGVRFPSASSASQGFIDYYHGSNAMVFATNSTERMRIDSSGNVGIGTNSPLYNFHVKGGANNTTALLEATSSNYVTYMMMNSSQRYSMQIRTDQSNAWVLRDETAAANRLLVDTSGNLLVGTTTAYGKITSTSATYSPTTSAWVNAAVTVYGGYSGGISLVDGSAGYTLNSQDSGKDFYIRGGATSGAPGGGVYLNDYATSWSSASDESVKDIIEPITDAVSKVQTLRTVIGKYKYEEDGKRHPFLIAQDVQAVLPEAVSVMNKDSENECLGLSYTDTIPLLVAAIKEQQAIIESLTKRIETLEGAA